MKILKLAAGLGAISFLLIFEGIVNFLLTAAGV